MCHNTMAATVPLSFQCITNNIASDCAIGEAQLGVEVTDLGNSQVQFDFFNSGPANSAITEVYFDDGSLLGISQVINGTGVSFVDGSASPGELPGANNISPAFETTGFFLADAQNPGPQNGVNPDEQLGIVFSLQGGQTYDNVIFELATGALRVGMHLTALDSGGSESFVNYPVPVPAALWLFGTALLVLTGYTGWRKKA
jgi:hypothetical protein